MRVIGTGKYKIPEEPTHGDVLFLIEALKVQNPPTEEVIGLAIEALRWLEMKFSFDEADEEYSRGGAPEATQTTKQASIVAALKDLHHVPIKSGVWAVEPANSPDGEKRREAIKRKCSDIRNGKANGYPISDEIIKATLDKIKNRK